MISGSFWFLKDDLRFLLVFSKDRKFFKDRILFNDKAGLSIVGSVGLFTGFEDWVFAENHWIFWFQRIQEIN
jgi:hypothetical protein